MQKYLTKIKSVFYCSGIFNILVVLVYLFCFQFATVFAQNDRVYDDQIFDDTIVVKAKEKKKLNFPAFQLINKDTIKLGPDDELVSDEYTAMGQPAVYDALHSFNYRRSDRFGGYINVKVNAGLERIRNKGFKSDIKKLYIQVNPYTLTVYWFAIVGPSTDKYSYVRLDSRGSAGGGIKAVEKQLPRMHGLYPDLVPVKLLDFNENVLVCYTWSGKMIENYCSYVNIQQHFFKYRQREGDDNIYTIVSETNTSTNKDIKEEEELIFEEYDIFDKTFEEVIFPKLTVKIEPKVEIKKEVKEAKEVKPVKIKPVKPKIYIVKSGDVLSKIAEKNHTTVKQIQKLNNLKGDQIQIGQSIKIPK
jgi:LysM repeat protein